MNLRTKLALVVALVLALAVAAPSAMAMSKKAFKEECERKGGQYQEHKGQVSCYTSPDKKKKSGELCILFTKGEFTGTKFCI